jgi:hypothetical protein
MRPLDTLSLAETSYNDRWPFADRGCSAGVVLAT